jgi:hypothetical protein
MARFGCPNWLIVGPDNAFSHKNEGILVTSWVVMEFFLLVRYPIRHVNLLCGN